MARLKRDVRVVELRLASEDVEYLDTLAFHTMTTRQDLIRQALYAHFPDLTKLHEERWHKTVKSALRAGD